MALGQNFLPFFIEVNIPRLAASTSGSVLVLSVVTCMPEVVNFSAFCYISHHLVQIDGAIYGQ